MKPEIQPGLHLQPFPTLPMASPLAPPADSGDTAPC